VSLIPNPSFIFRELFFPCALYAMFNHLWECRFSQVVLPWRQLRFAACESPLSHFSLWSPKWGEDS
jgi:hypothetical protein